LSQLGLTKTEIYDVLTIARCWTVVWGRQIQYTP